MELVEIRSRLNLVSNNAWGKIEYVSFFQVQVTFVCRQDF